MLQQATLSEEKRYEKDDLCALTPTHRAWNLGDTVLLRSKHYNKYVGVVDHRLQLVEDITVNDLCKFTISFVKDNCIKLKSAFKLHHKFVSNTLRLGNNSATFELHFEKNETNTVLLRLPNGGFWSVGKDGLLKSNTAVLNLDSVFLLVHESAASLDLKSGNEKLSAWEAIVMFTTMNFPSIFLNNGPTEGKIMNDVTAEAEEIFLPEEATLDYDIEPQETQNTENDPTKRVNYKKVEYIFPEEFHNESSHMAEIQREEKRREAREREKERKTERKSKKEKQREKDRERQIQKKIQREKENEDREREREHERKRGEERERKEKEEPEEEQDNTLQSEAKSKDTNKDQRREKISNSQDSDDELEQQGEKRGEKRKRYQGKNLDQSESEEEQKEEQEVDNEYEVEKIIGKKQDNRKGPLYQVKWKGYNEITWEPTENLFCWNLVADFEQSQNPNFLEEAREQFWKFVYERHIRWAVKNKKMENKKNAQQSNSERIFFHQCLP